MNKHNKFIDAYSNYFPIVLSSIYSKVGNKEDASDIAQEVFLRLFQKFDNVENVRRWLFTALKLVIKEFYRKKNMNEVDIDNFFNDISLTFVNGFRDTRIIISEAIESMDHFKDEKERILFDLIAVNNFSYSQAAVQLGMTRRQVVYKYNQIANSIIDYLRSRGIKDVEDLL